MYDGFSGTTSTVNSGFRYSRTAKAPENDLSSTSTRTFQTPSGASPSIANSPSKVPAAEATSTRAPSTGTPVTRLRAHTNTCRPADALTTASTSLTSRSVVEVRSSSPATTTYAPGPVVGTARSADVNL